MTTTDLRMNNNDLQSGIKILDLKARRDSLVAKRDLVESRLVAAQGRLTAARKAQTDIDAVQRTVQYVAARVQTGFGNYVGAIVTKAMHHVLDEPFRNLHGAAGRRRALRMLYNTSKALGIQTIIVHQSDIGDENAVDESLDVLLDEPGVAVYEVRKVAYEKSEVVRV